MWFHYARKKMNTINISTKTLYTFLLPFLFIVMWSSGYVAGKIGLEYTGPYTLLFIRFASAAVIMFLVAYLTKASWPISWRQYFHLIIVGILVQGVQFACLYTGMNLGVSSGISALIVGTMPIFTALLASWIFSEHVNFKQWCGAFLGILGVGLVVMDNSALNLTSFWGYFFVVLALIGITTGSLYQKYFCTGIDLRAAGFIQLVTASVFVFFFAWHFESFQMEFGWPLLTTSAWLSVINSIGAVTILFVLMKQGEASKVSSFFHLIPGTTALMGYFMLGETLPIAALVGFILTGLAVYLSH